MRKGPLNLLELRHRITLDEYHRMAEAGIFTEDDSIELLEGILIQKSPKTPAHAASTDLFGMIFARLIPDGWFWSSGNPMPIPEADSEPEPDIQIVRGRPRDYSSQGHGPRDVALVIEVAETSYAYESGLKLQVYARAAVLISWIVDLDRRVLEVFTEPTGPAPQAFYRQHRIYEPDDEVPLVLDGRKVARLNVRDILP